MFSPPAKSETNFLAAPNEGGAAAHPAVSYGLSKHKSACWTLRKYAGHTKLGSSSKAKESLRVSMTTHNLNEHTRTR